MSDYFAVLPLAPPLDRAGIQRLARHSCLDIHRVQWLRAYLATDGRRLLCWYQSHDAESVRFVLRQQKAKTTAVWPAKLSNDAGRDGLSDDGHRVAVELYLDEAEANGRDALISELTEVLADAGQTVSRVFTSRNGACIVIIIDGSAEAVVTDCFEKTGQTPASVWSCIEIDPKPPDLFESSARSAGIAGAQPARSGVAVDSPTDFDVVIIGAGISGVCMLHRLIGMGLGVRVYESATGVGGVWHWNRYPGARVDSESYSYLFSFSDELVEEWDWQELFSPQSEIERYLEHVVDRFDLRRHIRFDTRVTTASYDERRHRWVVATDTDERVSARFLIAATGTLTVAQLPDFPGIDDFAGQSHHTARWPKDGVQLAGKRVGVIGTGASGVQVIQTIASDVERLTVFQRTPTYCIPQRNRALTDEDRRRIRDDWSDILAACRVSYGGFIHTFDPRSGLAVSAKERESKFEELWQKPGFAFWFGNFADLMMSLEVNEYASEFIRRKIRERVDDPEVARKLLPVHPFGTKRVPLENGYYEIYNRNNVKLVDLRETPIVRITANGVMTTQDHYPLDVIVYATGFDVGTGALSRIDMRGVGGLSLAEKWRDGARTFLGLLVSDFPNLFIVNGPQNAAALCNAGRCIEQNVDWIAKCIEQMRAHGLTQIVPSAQAEQDWTEHVADVADGSVLGHMKESWFFGANTPGKPRQATIYAAGAREYRRHCQNVAHAGYPGCTMS